MKVLMSGATGLIGQALGQALVSAGHTVVALTRDPQTARQRLKYKAEIIKWDAETIELTADQLRDVEAVIHLAGENVGEKRWSEKRKQQILNSRVKGSENLVRAVNQHGSKVLVFISASGVSYYGFSKENEVLTEDSPKGEGFLAEVSEQWERPLKKLPHDLRNVIFRIAPVFARSGGFLATVVPLFRKGLGGKLGSGEQWMPWVDIDDVVLMMMTALAETSMAGVYNASASNVRNREFTTTLCKVLGVFQSLPAPAFALKLLFGEMSELLLKSQNVASIRWQRFQCQDLETALKKSLD